MLISFGMLKISKTVQEQYLNKKTTSIEEDVSANAHEDKIKPNFIIKDDISGKVILSINVSTEQTFTSKVKKKQ